MKKYVCLFVLNILINFCNIILKRKVEFSRIDYIDLPFPKANGRSAKEIYEDRDFGYLDWLSLNIPQYRLTISRNLSGESTLSYNISLILSSLLRIKYLIQYSDYLMNFLDLEEDDPIDDISQYH